MSCSMTIDAVRNRTKTVTRRHVDTWQHLKPGDRLTLIEKGMGLPRGAHQVVICEVEIVSVRAELLDDLFREEFATASEGLPSMSSGEFVEFWARSHGYGSVTDADVRQMPWNYPCRRIEWRYLDERAS